MNSKPESTKTERIDLRTDFISRPTAAMVEAMVAASAEPPGLGLREDPVVSRLEALAADVLGKEDALFCPTCTLCNQIAVNAFCRPGDVLVAPAGAHVLTSEGGAAAALSGALVHAVEAERGEMSPAAVEAAITPQPGGGRSRVGLVLIENTHLRSGGRVVSERNMREISAVASGQGVPVHLDGSRLFNAAAYLDVEPARLARHADTVAVSLNKGLSAPLGAILAGSARSITEAVEIRQRFGGGWRPAGIPAAAGIVALERMTGCMAGDHENARLLARGLAEIEGVSVLNQPVETNILFVAVRVAGIDREGFLEHLAGKGVLLLPFDGDTMRAVLHKDITAADVEHVVRMVAEVVETLAGGGTPRDPVD
jgi:threonine aldolase